MVAIVVLRRGFFAKLSTEHDGRLQNVPDDQLDRTTIPQELSQVEAAGSMVASLRYVERYVRVLLVFVRLIEVVVARRYSRLILVIYFMYI